MLNGEMEFNEIIGCTCVVINSFIQAESVVEVSASVQQQQQQQKTDNCYTKLIAQL